ncbi:MAG: DUF2752 domain-containing protein [Planctomycetota bacterium]
MWLQRVILCLCFGGPVAVSFALPRPLPEDSREIGSPYGDPGEGGISSRHIYTLPCCLFRALTGAPCPLCGLTRSFVSLSHGDFKAAFLFHPFGPVLYLAFIAGCLMQLKPPHPPRPGKPPPLPGRLQSHAGILLVIGLLAAWGLKLVFVPRPYW